MSMAVGSMETLVTKEEQVTGGAYDESCEKEEPVDKKDWEPIP